MNSLSRVPTLLVILVAVTAFIAGVYLALPTPSNTATPDIEGLLWPNPPKVEAFSLIDAKGARFDETNLDGHWTLVFFGFTHCPDVCPGTLTTLKAVAGRLAGTPEFASRGQVLFVSVDPERDTPEVLQRYVEHFDPSFLAATAPPAELAAFKGQELYLDGLTEVSPEAADCLARFKGGRLSLDGLKTLSADAAAALAASKAWTGLLPNLEALDAATAAVLVAFQGTKSTPAVIVLSRLKEIDGETARALAAPKGHFFHVPGLTSLSAEAATALAGSDAWRFGSLPGITALDSPDAIAVAKALATRKGPLSLPNLKKISPKTLTALIQKEDVRLPLIETLEIIPETDGTPADDVVIPEGFERQQREDLRRQQEQESLPQEQAE